MGSRSSDFALGDRGIAFRAAGVGLRAHAPVGCASPLASLVDSRMFAAVVYWPVRGVAGRSLDEFSGQPRESMSLNNLSAFERQRRRQQGVRRSEAEALPQRIHTGPNESRAVSQCARALSHPLRHSTFPVFMCFLP